MSEGPAYAMGYRDGLSQGKKELEEYCFFLLRKWKREPPITTNEQLGDYIVSLTKE